MLATSEESDTWNLRVPGQTICSIALNERQGGWIRQERSVWLIWSNAIALALWTRAGEILSANGNANRVADSYFLPRRGNLIDNQSGLKGRIVTCR